jgi:hypothetical protein
MIEFIETPKAPQPQPAATPPPTPLSPEEIQKTKEQVFKSMGWGEPPKEAAPVAPATPPAEPSVPPATVTPAAPAAPAPAPAAAPATPPATIAEPPKSPTAREIAQEVITELGAQPATPAAPASPAAPEFRMNTEDQADYDVLVYLEGAEPEKWKGKPDEFMAYVKKHYAYIAEWEKANQDQTFDSNASEHEKWYSDNQPDIDPKDIEAGRIARDTEARVRRQIEPEIQKIKSQRVMEQAQPVIAQTVAANVSAFVEKVSPEIHKILKGDKPAPVFSAENLALADAHDPIANRIMDNICGSELVPIIAELERVVYPESGVRFNPAVNMIHARIAMFQNQAEEAQMKLPAADRVRDGREFIPQASMVEKQKAIESSSKSKSQKEQELAKLDGRYRTLTPDELEQFIVDHYTKIAQDRIKDIDSLAQKKYKPSNGVGQPPVPPVVVTPAVPAPALGGSAKPNSPSIGSSADSVHTQASGAAPAKSFAEKYTEAQFKP